MSTEREWWGKQPVIEKTLEELKEMYPDPTPRTDDFVECYTTGMNREVALKDKYTRLVEFSQMLERELAERGAYARGLVAYTEQCRTICEWVRTTRKLVPGHPNWDKIDEALAALPVRCETCKDTGWITTSYPGGPEFECSCPDCDVLQPNPNPSGQLAAEASGGAPQGTPPPLTDEASGHSWNRVMSPQFGTAG